MKSILESCKRWLRSKPVQVRLPVPLPTDDDVVGLIRSVPCHFVDLSVTAANVASGTDAEFLDVTFGAAVTAGQPCYRDAATGRYKPGLSAGSSDQGRCVGIAVDGGGNGQPGRLQVAGDITVGATIAIGVVYMAGLVAGGIMDSAQAATGHFNGVLGVGISTTVLRMGVILHNGTSHA